MTPREIRAHLILSGVRQKEIADQLGVSKASVSRVIDGHSRSARIQLAIARAIGRPAHQVFPDKTA